MAGIDPKACVVEALCAHGAHLRRQTALRVPAAELDDVMQLAALRAVEKADTLKDPERVLPWLIRIHANAAVDAARKRANERRLMEAIAAEPAAPAAEAEPLCGCSIAQAQGLSPNYASILNLVDIGGLPLRRAAEALNISVNNATVRLHRARAALKTRMREHCGVTSVRECVSCRCSRDGCCAA